MRTRKEIDELKKKLKMVHDTERERLRRQTDPAYLKRYNAMRKAYEERKKRDSAYQAKIRARRQRYEANKKRKEKVETLAK